MTTMCPDCGREISLDAPACIGCGKPKPGPGWPIVKRRMAYWPVIVAIVAITIAVFARGKKEVVFNSADGSVAQVVDYLHENLSDPGSFEALEWGQVSKFNGGFAVRLKYRHKEYYGGLELKDELFMLGKNGTVESIADWR